MPRAALVLNAGSSSVKFALAEIDGRSLRRVARGELEGIGTAPHLVVRDAAGKTLIEQRWRAPEAPDYETLLGTLLSWIESHLGPDTLAAVGHRVVHGGRDFTAPARVTPAVLQALTRLTPLAPLHQPHNLSPIRAILSLKPDLPQVACFDTAFHHTLPAVATQFALPRSYEEEGVRRYGFHGLSYEYISRRLRETAPDMAAGRVIVAHLGNGASLCAMRDGKSLDTTMGFTALDGLMMGTRCGAIDPGVLLYMQQQKGIPPHEIEHVLYSESGLLGVSGTSSDMRDLLASDDPRAREAVELFVFRIARDAAALAGSLGGLDGFVFTAGIGEHAAAVRAAVCERLRWLGVVPDLEANLRDATRISTAESRVEVRVMPTDEEVMILLHTIEAAGLAASAPPSL
jgi:acetate kinase